MLRLAIFCEDNAHALSAWLLINKKINAIAIERGDSWILEGEEYRFECIGDVDAEHLAQGLKYIQNKNAKKKHGSPGWGRGYSDKKMGPSTKVGRKPIHTSWYRTIANIRLKHKPSVILLMQDTDGSPQKLMRLRATVDELMQYGSHIPVIFVTPHQEVEAWVIAGLNPDSSEAKRMEELSLSFIPTHEPHRLVSDKNSPHDCKKVLNKIINNGNISKPLNGVVLQRTLVRSYSDLNVLATRGKETMLPEFLQEIEDKIYPLLAG